MSLLVDTSVWSLALRRDVPEPVKEDGLLVDAIDSGVEIYASGIILQELLQGFTTPKAHDSIVERFAAFPMLVPDTKDYIDTANIRNRCRQKGVLIDTIDALIAQLSLRFELSLLTTDKDFQHMSKVVGISLAS